MDSSNNNDAFARRFTLSGFEVSTTGLNSDFTGEVGEPNHAGISGELNSAWWTWIAPTSGEVTLDTFGSDFDTSLAVYTGGSLGTLSEVASNDDTNSLQSQVTFNTFAGTAYQIAVDGFAGATGNIALNLNLMANNDDFASRFALSGFNASATGANVGFTGEVSEPNHAGVSQVSNSAWWTWTAPVTGEVTLDTFGSDFDTSLAIYNGNRLSELVEVASNDDAGSLQSEVIFGSVEGTTYQIAVDGFATNTGNIELNLRLSPNNDNFANRDALNGSEIEVKGSNVGFGGETGEPDHAGISGAANSAWWTWIAPNAGEVRLDTFGSDFDISLAVYTGNRLSELIEVASNDDVGSLQSEVVFDAVAGTAYQIAVDGFGNATGNIDLSLNLVPEDIGDGPGGDEPGPDEPSPDEPNPVEPGPSEPGPVEPGPDEPNPVEPGPSEPGPDEPVPSEPTSNDNFADRSLLEGNNLTLTGSNLGFTGEVNEPDHAGVSGVLNSAWWTWTAPTDGEVILNTIGSDFDTSLAVYTGEALDDLSEVASNDDTASLQSSVIFDAVAGTTYQIAVDGFADEVGNITLNLQQDDPTNPLPLSTVDLILDFDGGLLESDQGYDIPSAAFDGVDFSAFSPFAQSDGSSGDVNEQIFQILAGVREDFADFNIRVIWDDRGVNSPLFDEQDTVLMVVGDTGSVIDQGNIFGIAANVDVPQFTGAPLQSRRDTGFAFAPAHAGVGPNTFNEIRELIDTISHEAGHTFGLSHSIEQDSEGRQLVTTAGQNSNLDSRFTAESLNHGPPEFFVSYASTDRLNEAVGAASVLPGDSQSSQTLPLEPTTTFVGEIDPNDPVTSTGSVDFLGDRDAFRFETTTAGEYTIEQTATLGSLLAPALTLWDVQGDFVSLGSLGGGSSRLTFNAGANETFYAVAGSEVDRLPSGLVATGEIGGYNLTFG